jgi:hypothetical protein
MNMIRTSENIILSPAEFKRQHRHVSYGSELPSQEFLESIGASVVDVEESAGEIGVAAINQRNAELSATDWWAMSDLTMNDDQRAYRQALRDLPSQAGFPYSITWPTKP